jgi:hypothetical protein
MGSPLPARGDAGGPAAPESMRPPSWLAVLLVASVALRVAIAAAAGPPERWEYDAIAQSLVEGRGFVYHDGTVEHRTYGAPLYVLLTYAAYALVGAPRAELWLVALQGGFTALAARLGYALAARLFDARAAALAAVLIVLHPGLALYDSRKLHSLSLDALALGWIAFLLACFDELCALRARGRRWAALAGIGLLCGLALWERPTGLPFFAVAAPCLAWRTRFASRARALAGLLALLLGAALAFAPWLARNARVYGAFVPAGLNAGVLFWRGHGVADPWSAFPELVPLDERERERRLLALAWARVRSDPSRFARESLGALGGLLWLRPGAGASYPRAYLVAYAGWFLLTAGLALVGLARRARQAAPAEGRPRARLWPLLGLAASVAAIHAVFGAQMRHRFALEPTLLVLSGGAAAARRREPPRG